MAIRWDESLPLNTDTYAGLALAFRSFKTDFATGISTAMYWPGSGGGSLASAGQMVLGTFRTWLDVQSAYSVPSPATTGSLYQTSNSSRFFGATSASTVSQFLGSARALEHQTWAGQRARWVISTGTYESTWSGTGPDPGDVISYGTTYDVAPRVLLSIATNMPSTSTILTVYVDETGLATNQCLPRIVNAGGVNRTIKGVPLHWVSLGTITF